MPDDSTSTDGRPGTDGTDLDLRIPRRVHVVGIGGAGMSAIATVLAAMGHQVSGSDLKESAGLERLRSLGVTVAVGHSADNLPAELDAVTISTAVPAHNPEVRAAHERGVPVLRRAEALAAIAATRRSVAVAGTHGKTTTSSMLGLVLIEAGLRPSFIIGGDVNEIGSGAVWDEGDLLVVEADESDGTFLELPRHAAIVTNVEPDHLEFYGGFDALKAAFVRFLAETPGPRVVCADDELAAELGAAVAATTYGTSADADYRMVDLTGGRGGSTFAIEHGGVRLGEVQLPIAGAYNARNATAALVTGLELGASFEAGRAALARFAGVARRFEHRGEVAGVTFIDDYAHLPSEVASVLSATHQGDWGRVVCIFQPHRYSRTAALWPDFADAFGEADLLVVTDIYPSGEAPRPGVSGKLVAQAVIDHDPWRRLAYLPRRADVVGYLRHELRAGDLCLTLGAGDLTSLPEEVQQELRGVTAEAVADALAEAAALLGERARHDVPLGPATTYRVGGPAALFVAVDDDETLAAVADAVRITGVAALVVGRGSNLLVADAGFDGLAVTLGEHFATFDVSGPVVTAGGAASLPVVARRTAAAGLTGFEWAVGVPGSVGGAVRMNAGGHGSDMAASLLRVRVLDLATGEDEVVPAADLDLGYRRSAVGPSQIVLAADLQLDEGDRDRSEALIADIVRWRREHQPGGPNAGSVFTNPPDDSAGRLIESVGARGLRLGTAQVSPKHANFIQADEGGRADDVRALMVEVARRVEEATGVRLHAETRLVGFDEPRSQIEGS